MTNTNTVLEIVSFFEDIEDVVNEMVDRIEIEPIPLSSTLYITGFKHSEFSYTSMEAHVKQIRKLKLNNLQTSATSDGGYYLMEPDGEVWMDCALLADGIVKGAFNSFKEKFGKLNSFHVMKVSFREKGSAVKQERVIIYESKRVACKEALQMKKIYDDVHPKFSIIQNEEGKEHEPTDFEIAIAAAE